MVKLMVNGDDVKFDTTIFPDGTSQVWRVSQNLFKDDEIKIAIQVNGKVRAETMIAVNESEDVIKAMALKAVAKYVVGEPKKVIYVKNRLINIVI